MFTENIIYLHPGNDEALEMKENISHKKFHFLAASHQPSQQQNLFTVLPQHNCFPFLTCLHTRVVVIPGLWIRIDSIRIRIQHFSSIRIHKIIESGSNADPDPIYN
jgi:hypothetical protein